MAAQQELDAVVQQTAQIRPQTASAQAAAGPQQATRVMRGLSVGLETLFTCYVDGGVWCESGFVGGANDWAVQRGLSAAVVWIEG